ncbi:MAG: hypothetical protein NTV81_00870 [Candidatus Komeilibacteria bacterium]|nr:hypothetical protein [Candidatus Komeilibacteria bacterium]
MDQKTKPAINPFYQELIDLGQISLVILCAGPAILPYLPRTPSFNDWVLVWEGAAEGSELQRLARIKFEGFHPTFSRWKKFWYELLGIAIRYSSKSENCEKLTGKLERLIVQEMSCLAKSFDQWEFVWEFADCLKDKSLLTLALTQLTKLAETDRQLSLVAYWAKLNQDD